MFAADQGVNMVHAVANAVAEKGLNALSHGGENLAMSGGAEPVGETG
jgi:hypothetical protein